MMWWKVTFILFFCVFQTYSSTINNTKQYAPHISAILNNLNSNPNKIYDYKKGTFISYQQKADIEELTVDVDVSCTVNYPGVPCTQQVLTCNAFLRYNDGKYQVLSDVLCKPKTDSSTENVDVLNTDLTQSGAHHGSKLELSNEDISGGENADFVAVKVDKVPCVGCPFDLNTDVEGVSTLVNTALRHIESERNQKQVALKVHRLQQQVVAGVKYILTLEVAPTVCQKDVELLENCPLDPNGSSSFCEVIFLQKPWISKDKLIIGNNCTISQEYTTESKINGEMTNDKATKQLSSDQKGEEMSAQRLADMESQILIMDVENQKPVLKNKLPKKVEYSVSFGDPSNNEVLSLYKNSVRNDPLVATSPYNENQAAQQKPLQELDEVNNKKEEDNLQEGSREKRDILSLKHQSSDSDSDSSEENNQKRFVRDLKGINSHETSESQEDSKTEESFRFKRSQDLDETNSDTSESQEDNTRELVKPKRSALSFLKIPRAKRSIDSRSSSTKTEQNVSKNKIEKNDDSSDSSSSSSDDNNENEKSDHDNRIYVKGISNNKKKKNYDNSDSSSSSSDGDSKSNESDHDDNRSSLKHSRSKNSRSKTNDDSSDSSSSSSEEKSENRKSDSSSSSSDNNSENKKSDSSSSSSDEKSENRKSDSSSSSSDDNSENKKRDSSSSSSDNKSENRKSSSSSSSSSENSREENDIKYTNYINHIKDTNERKHDISSNIKINKVKRSVGQLEKITQEEKFLVRDLAEFAASSLDDIDDDNHKRVILQILSAKKLKLDGIYYHIILRLGISQCSENEEDENCRENLFPNLTKICKVLVHVEDDLSNPKIVKSQCQNIKKDDRDRNRTNYGRYRRKIVVGASSDMSSHNPKMSRLTRDSETEQGKEVKDELVGGVQEESPDSLTATYYLEAILNHLNKELDNKDKLKVQKIISATSQVVAGTLWRIRAQVTSENKNQTCNFRIWSRPWINDTEVTQTCEDSETKSFRLRRSTGAVKYIIPSSVDNNEPNPKILQYVKKGLRYLDSKSDHKTKYIIKSIKKISKQMVAGKLWHVTADIALSDCPKQHYTQYCEELDDGTTKTCYFVIWEQPWLSDGMQINITCENDENTYSISPKDFHLVKTFYADESLDKFHEFIIKHNKTYLYEVEFNYRFKVFKDNLNRIKLLNNYEQGTAQYGITRFADLTEEEFSKSHGLRLDLHNDNEAPFSYAQIPDTDLPTEFDWRKKGAVTEVKNQGSCGSCWAFSTTGNIEGQYAIKYGKLLEFSEQELVDCDKLDEGCNGGLMDNAYRTIEKIGGLEIESDYPYDAEDEKCHFDKTKARVQLSGAVNISHNEDDMAKWLVKNGPISIAINANAMQFYVGGVSHPWKILCNPKNLDHGVLIVGYGVHNYPLFNKTLPYWIVKNSWGPSWGEQGYYRVFRGDGTCGLNQTPSSAIVA